MTRNRSLAAAAAAALAVGTLSLGASTASAAPKHEDTGTTEVSAKLHQLNRSGAQGTATATVTGTTLTDVSLTARGLTPDGPHAVHIHYGETAEHECPTMGDASQRRADGTRRINVADGVPYYGPIAATLTTAGDTTPASALALDRAPTSSAGVLSYARPSITLTDVTGVGSASSIAAAIRAGEGVVVVHGVDYNRNNAYDFDGAGASELTSAAPAEATDPALCGVLEPAHKHKH